MRKVYKLDEIDCPTCAQKLQDALAKVDGVRSVSINFLTQKLTLEADGDRFDAILDRVVKLAAELEPDCEIAR